MKYEVIEYLTVDQAKRYAAMPMQGYSSGTESLTYDGVTYQVVKVNSYASTIGENKNRRDVDPYTTKLTFTNLMPVCKITDKNGNLLYRRYDWEKTTNKTGEGPDGGSYDNQPYYYAPAVYTELTGNDGAFKALDGTLYSSNGSNPTSYSVSNGVQIQLLIGDYRLNEAVTVKTTSKVTLTTASTSDALFPKQDPGSTSTIQRAFADASMFDVKGDLTYARIILDGAKGTYTVGVKANGGIANVSNAGKLTVQDGATLRNSKTAVDYSGGAVYVASGGTATMTGGTINQNESVGDGAGIYLAPGSTLNFSGNPSFGGTGLDVAGNISMTNGNFQTTGLLAETNGGKDYRKARQDIYLAETTEDPASIVLTGDLTGAAGSIWVWANDSKHYIMGKPFATKQSNITLGKAAYLRFRDARPDSATLCEDVYRTGSRGTNPDYVYWTSSVDFHFKKTYKSHNDETVGVALPGAKFALYTDEECTESLMLNDKAVEAISSDGITTKDAAGNVITAGEVLFEKLPLGVYYMKETVIPTKDKDGNVVSIANDGFTYRITIEINDEGDEVEIDKLLEYWAGDAVKWQALSMDENDAYIIVNREAICKATDSQGNILYKDAAHRIPAVYGELNDDILNGTTLFTGTGASHTGAYCIKMLIPEYTLPAELTLNSGKTMTLTTAGKKDKDYPYTGTEGTFAVIFRDKDYEDGYDKSLISSSGALTLTEITLNGDKDNCEEVSADGGLINVAAGSVTIANGATLQDSATTGSGGAVYVADGTLTMTGGSINGNSAAKGGAVYVKAEATMEMSNSAGASGGTVNGNTAVTNGAGIYLEEHSTLKLSGSPNFGGAGTDTDEALVSSMEVDGETVVTGNFLLKKDAPYVYTEEDSERPTNGQKPYAVDQAKRAYKVRQDVFVAGYSDEGGAATSIVVTGKINSGDGTIWVWADQKEHYEMLKQFAVLGPGVTVDETTMHAFRNAQDDETTGCGAEYLTGQDGDDIGSYKCVYWTGGFDFVFKKIGPTGDPLPGANFTLYMSNDEHTAIRTEKDDEDNDVEVAYQQIPEGGTVKADAVATSKTVAEADAVAIKVNTGTEAAPVLMNPDPKVYGDGLVVFKKIPPGVYFIKETTDAEGNVQIGNEKYKPVEEMYMIDINGKGYYTIYVPTVAEDGTVSWVMNDEHKASLEKLSFGTGDDAYTVDVPVALNVSSLSRKVILRKALISSRWATLSISPNRRSSRFTTPTSRLLSRLRMTTELRP